MKKVLLFGGSGFVGLGIKQFLSDRYQIIAPTHAEVDVTKIDHVTAIIEQIHPDNIIYAVGLTSVDKAEQEPELAYLLNAKIPVLVAKEASFFGIPFLYFSTDAVFDGTKNTSPYKETDKTNPISVYGKSKLLGEQMVMNISNKNCVVRLIMPYSTITSKRKNFVSVILDAFKQGERIYGITDQVINPIPVNDVAEALNALIKNKASGIYHLGATDYVTNIEFIRKLAKIFNYNENLIEEISFEEFFRGKKAQRTKFCWLDTIKIRKKFGNDMLHIIDEGIMLFKKNLEKNTSS